MRKQILALHKAFGQCHLNCSQAVEQATSVDDFAKMAMLSGGQDSLPTNLAYGGNDGFQSFLEKWKDYYLREERIIWEDFT